MARATLRRSLLMSLAPLGLFSILILTVTGFVLGAVEAKTHEMAAALARGDLSLTDIQAVGIGLRLTWLGSLAGFFLFTAGTTVLSLRVHRVVRERLERIATFAQRRADGEMIDDLEAEGDGPIADLEQAISEISRTIQERDDALRRDERRARVETQLQRAFDLADTEPECLDVVERALGCAMPQLAAEALLADSSRAHLRRVAVRHGVEPPGCPVERPFQCAAVRRGHTLEFASSESLDACPKLREHAGAPCSAVCTPINVMGHTIGVLHVTDEEHEEMDQERVRLLEAVATQAGARLGMVRTLASTQLQARTDPLTRLLNRRSFEEEVARRLREAPADAPSSVVMCDLDHFKRLNDTAGHEAGDRALKLFAETLRSSVRPSDVVGRHGGEEFVLFLPGCDEAAAVEAMERVREHLETAVGRYAGPSFTASFGVASVAEGERPLPERIREADQALYEAKRRGRDRVVAASAMGGEEAPVAGGPAEVRRLAPAG